MQARLIQLEFTGRMTDFWLSFGPKIARCPRVRAPFFLGAVTQIYLQLEPLRSVRAPLIQLELTVVFFFWCPFSSPLIQFVRAPLLQLEPNDRLLVLFWCPFPPTFFLPCPTRVSSNSIH